MALLNKDLRVPPDYTISQPQLLQSILQKQLYFPVHRTNTIWRILGQIIVWWILSLKLEPFNSIRDISLNEWRKRAADLSSDQDAVRTRPWVESILQDVGLPSPTLILSPTQQLHWTLATRALYDTYTTNGDIKACIADVKRKHNLEYSGDEVNYWICFQMRLIIKADDKALNGTVQKPLCSIESTMQQALDTGTRIRILGQGVPTSSHAGSAQDATTTKPLLSPPKALLGFMEITLKSLNAVGNYDTGIPW